MIKTRERLEILLGLLYRAIGKTTRLYFEKTKRVAFKKSWKVITSEQEYPILKKMSQTYPIMPEWKKQSLKEILFNLCMTKMAYNNVKHHKYLR